MGALKTYNLAFLTVDRLIQEKGLAVTIAYLRSGNFEGAFETSAGDIAAKVEKSLLERLPVVNFHGLDETGAGFIKYFWQVDYARLIVGLAWLFIHSAPQFFRDY